jgi:hypothetical protein
MSTRILGDYKATFVNPITTLLIANNGLHISKHLAQRNLSYQQPFSTKLLFMRSEINGQIIIIIIIITERYLVFIII